MKCALMTALILISLCCSVSFGQEISRIDSTLIMNIGPNQARGTVESVKRHIPFHQHLWKVIEYPTEGVMRIVSLPFIGAGHLIDRDYAVGDLAQIFYFDNRKGYIFPSFISQSDKGISGAVRFNHNSLLPASTGLSFKAEYGGRIERAFSVRLLKEGFLHRSIEFSFAAQDIRDPDRYSYGVGMASDEDERLQYTQKDKRVVGELDISASSDLSINLIAGYGQTVVEAGNTEDRWEVGLGAEYDDRPYGDNSSYGWKISGFTRRVLGAKDRDPDYWKYGASIGRNIGIFGRARVLQLSAETRGVRRINNDTAPLWSLPILGGEDRLRGFPVDRFRDYVTLLFSAQYRYPIFRRFSGCLFVDFGSAALAWESFELSDFRTGYGWKLLTHISDDFVFKFQIAHSRDGFQLYVGTSTVLDIAEKGMFR